MVETSAAGATYRRGWSNLSSRRDARYNGSVIFRWTTTTNHRSVQVNEELLDHCNQNDGRAEPWRMRRLLLNKILTMETLLCLTPRQHELLTAEQHCQRCSGRPLTTWVTYNARRARARFCRGKAILRAAKKTAASCRYPTVPQLDFLLFTHAQVNGFRPNLQINCM